MIEVITNSQASEIINTRSPRGKFLVIEKGIFVGIDNQTGDAWTEDFTDLKRCIKYLNGENPEQLGA